MTDPDAINLDSIEFGFERGSALFHSFSLTVKADERVAIVGASGAGKSTLLEIIAGLCKIDGGSRDVCNRRGEAPKFGYIFQKDALLPWYSVERNIELQAGMVNVNATDYEKVSERWMQKLGVFPFRKKLPHQLSGGERQRASIAMTLSAEPDILLLDEPSANLDYQNKLVLEEELIELLYTVTPMASVLVTHDIDQAIILADRVIVLARKEGEPAKIVHEICIELPAEQRLPAIARRSEVVREAFEQIWELLRPCEIR